MAHETRQQIIENTRRKVVGQYAEQVRNLKAKNKEYWNKLCELQNKSAHSDRRRVNWK